LDFRYQTHGLDSHKGKISQSFVSFKVSKSWFRKMRLKAFMARTKTILVVKSLKIFMLYTQSGLRIIENGDFKQIFVDFWLRFG